MSQRQPFGPLLAVLIGGVAIDGVIVVVVRSVDNVCFHFFFIVSACKHIQQLPFH